jgi:preprotein translocase subunit YajC
VPVIAASGGGLGIFPILIFGFLILYLLVVRPRQRRQNQQQQRLSELRVGDEVITAGGIYGTISSLGDDYVEVEIAPKLQVRVARRAIAAVTSEPEPEEAGEPEDQQENDGGEEKWRSAFDEDDSSGPIRAGDTQDEENRG